MIIQPLTSTPQAKTKVSGGIKPLIETSKPVLQQQTPVVQITPNQKKVDLDTVKKGGLSDFGREFVSGFKIGVPQVIGALKKTASDVMNVVSKSQKAKSESILTSPIMKEVNRKTSEVLSEKAKKLKENAINDFKVSKIESEKLPNLDQGSFIKNIQDPSWLGRNIGQSVPNLVTSLGIGLLAGPVAGVSVGAGISYSLESSFAYIDALEYGADEATANKVGVIVGGINAVLETLPLGRLLNKTKDPVGLKKALTREMVKGIMKQTVLEGGTESLQEIVSNAVATTYDKDRKLFDGVPESAFIGGLLGAGTSVVIEAPIDFIKNKEIVNKETTPDEAIAFVINNKLEKTEVGKAIVKQAMEAKNKDTTIKITENGKKINVEVVSKEEIKDKGLPTETAGGVPITYTKTEASKTTTEAPSLTKTTDLGTIKKREHITLPKVEGVKTASASIRGDTASMTVQIADKGKGLGKQTVQKLEQEILNRGVNKVVIDASSKPAGKEWDNSVGFWEKQGYKQIGKEVNGLVKMEKTLETSTKGVESVSVKDIESGLSKMVEDKVVTDTPKIKQLMEDYKSGKNIPAIPVYKKNGKYIVNKDGFHRLTAQKNLGVTNIKVKVEPKTELTATQKQKVENESPQISAKQTPLSPTKVVSPTQAQKGDSPTEKFKTRVLERMREEYPDVAESVFLDKVTFEKEFQKATDLIINDKQKAFDIAMGKEYATEAESVATNIALAEKALEEGNEKLFARLVTNRSIAQSKRGQAIVLEKASITDNSVSRYVKELVSARMDKLGDRYLSSLTKYKVSTKEQAVKVINEKVVELETKIKNKKLDVKTALSLLEELTCI